ncbi:hypothetical protein ACLB2K_031742 [Fragaria x ananassa]
MPDSVKQTWASTNKIEAQILSPLSLNPKYQTWLLPCSGSLPLSPPEAADKNPVIRGDNEFVRNDAKIFRFCRSKCHKNFKMKRNPRKVKWTKAYRRLRGKDMTQDSTFEFERKRNRPERYDRNLAENTLKAIKKIDKVRVDREAKHHEKRMKGRKTKIGDQARKELIQSINMVQAPDSIRQDRSEKIKVPKQVEQTAMEVEE